MTFTLTSMTSPHIGRVVAAGGTIHIEEQEVPGMGWFSLFTDPEGRMMGLWKTQAQMS
jgi:predicted enzyme related to lactoylglutathione lyase